MINYICTYCFLSYSYSFLVVLAFLGFFAMNYQKMNKLNKKYNKKYLHFLLEHVLMSEQVIFTVIFFPDYQSSCE